MKVAQGRNEVSVRRTASRIALAGIALLAAQMAFAGPFGAGVGTLQTNILTILTPLAVIAVMVVGVAAWFNKISWGWVVAAIGGTVLVFGSPQIVAWIRSMFGV